MGNVLRMLIKRMKEIKIITKKVIVKKNVVQKEGKPINRSWKGWRIGGTQMRERL